MTHLEDLLARWDHYSKGESETTRQIREAIEKDKQSTPTRNTVLYWLKRFALLSKLEQFNIIEKLEMESQKIPGWAISEEVSENG